MTPNKLIALLCVAVLMAIGGCAAGVVILIDDIQESRKKVILENCEGQNERNKNTIKELVVNIAALPPNQRTQGEKSIAFTVSLIDSLAPYRDCDEVLKKANL